MRWLALLVVMLLPGCGEGYVAPTAELRVEFASEQELEAASNVIQDELKALGFEVQSATIDLQGYAPVVPQADIQMTATSKITFWRHTSQPVDSDMHGDMIGYAASPGSNADGANNEHLPFVQIILSDFWPGGFSPEGLRIYSEFVSVLEEHGYRITVITPPPPTDYKEKSRVDRVNLIAAVGWWIAVWSMSMATLGGLSMWLLRSTKTGPAVRRIALVAVGVFLATPFPVSSAFVTVLLPNALVLLFGLGFYADLWGEAETMIVYPLAASAILSILAAILLVRDRRVRNTGGSDL